MGAIYGQAQPARIASGEAADPPSLDRSHFGHECRPVAHGEAVGHRSGNRLPSPGGAASGHCGSIPDPPAGPTSPLLGLRLPPVRFSHGCRRGLQDAAASAAQDHRSRLGFYIFAAALPPDLRKGLPFRRAATQLLSICRGYASAWSFYIFHAAAACVKARSVRWMSRCSVNSGWSTISLRSSVMRSRQEGRQALRRHLGSRG